MINVSRPSPAVIRALAIGSWVACASPVLQAQDTSDTSFEGMVPAENSRADEAYFLPDADFSVYNSFMILEPEVAFKRNWQRNQNRGQPLSRQVSSADMERIKNGMKELFLEVFTTNLEEAGYAVVETPGDNVMVLRPAIIDLDVTAPEIQSAARVDSYIASAGSARIYIEFFDSVTGQILARAIDHQRASNNRGFEWASAASNRAEARRVLERWAGMLVEHLDEIHRN